MVVCTSGNAIILEDNGNMIKYKRQCSHCGYTDSQESLCSVLGSVSQRPSSSCPECGKFMGPFDFKRY